MILATYIDAGLTTFTLILCGPNSIAKDFASMSRAAFDMEYTPIPGRGFTAHLTNYTNYNVNQSTQVHAVLQWKK